MSHQTEERSKITRAQTRVLQKASEGFVMISGGFSGVEDPDCIQNRLFDRRIHIEKLIANKMLVDGVHANKYLITPLGYLALLAARSSWKDPDTWASECSKIKE